MANSILLGIIIKINATIHEEYLEDEYYEYDNNDYNNDYNNNNNDNQFNDYSENYDYNDNYDDNPNRYRRSKRKNNYR